MLEAPSVPLLNFPFKRKGRIIIIIIIITTITTVLIKRITLPLRLYICAGKKEC